MDGGSQSSRTHQPFLTQKDLRKPEEKPVSSEPQQSLSVDPKKHFGENWRGVVSGLGPAVRLEEMRAKLSSSHS